MLWKSSGGSWYLILGWARPISSSTKSARSPELNRAEREGFAEGYYEGLIGGNAATDDQDVAAIHSPCFPQTPLCDRVSRFLTPVERHQLTQSHGLAASAGAVQGRS